MAVAGVNLRPVRRPKFWIAYAVLGLLLVSAGIGLGYELQSHPKQQSVAWSSWSPSVPGVGGVVEIASHVAGSYRLPDGEQLSRIKASYPGTAGTVDPSAPDVIRIPVTSIALASTDSTGQTSYDLLPGYPSTIEYQLCGSGPKCQISDVDGGPTAQTAQALRRQALELSLYTFRYIPEISQVLVLMPPGARGAQPQAVLMEAGGPINLLLSQPLSLSLPPGESSTATQHLVDSLTAPSFAYSYQQLFDGTYQMVLSLPR